MKVMIVDDERNAREVLKDELSKIPSVTEITEFANPLTAFEYVKENPVDVAFLDIEMYEMTGIEMAKQIKDIQPKTNIVFVTGYAQYGAEAFDTDASDFLLKPATVERIQKALSRLRNPVSNATSRIRVQTFGNFEVFVDGLAVNFPRTKSKEMFAYLIHKRGTSCTIKELSAAVFEDKDYNVKHMQTYISAMVKALADVGVKDVIIRKRNSLAVNTGKFDCDSYRFADGNVDALNEYTGEYMASYSWAEFMASYLENRIK